QAAPAIHPAGQQAGLSAAVAGWLDRVAQAVAPPGAGTPGSKPRPNQRHLYYVLDHSNAPTGDGAAARVRPVSVRLRKDGSVAEEKPYDIENAFRPQAQRASFLTEDDIAILGDLKWLGHTGGHGHRIDVPLGSDAVSLRAL